MNYQILYSREHGWGYTVDPLGRVGYFLSGYHNVIGKEEFLSVKQARQELKLEVTRETMDLLSKLVKAEAALTPEEIPLN